MTAFLYNVTRIQNVYVNVIQNDFSLITNISGMLKGKIIFIVRINCMMRFKTFKMGAALLVSLKATDYHYGMLPRL